MHSDRAFCDHPLLVVKGTIATNGAVPVERTVDGQASHPRAAYQPAGEAMMSIDRLVPATTVAEQNHGGLPPSGRQPSVGRDLVSVPHYRERHLSHGLVILISANDLYLPHLPRYTTSAERETCDAAARRREPQPTRKCAMHRSPFSGGPSGTGTWRNQNQGVGITGSRSSVPRTRRPRQLPSLWRAARR